MNMSYRIDHDQRIIFVEWSGVVTGEVALNATRTLLRAPGFSPYYNRLYDVREVSEINLSKANLLEFSLVDPIYPSERRAAVAKSPSVFGTGRMFGLLTGTEEIGNFRMFWDYEKALEWVSESNEVKSQVSTEGKKDTFRGSPD